VRHTRKAIRDRLKLVWLDVSAHDDEHQLSVVVYLPLDLRDAGGAGPLIEEAERVVVWWWRWCAGTGCCCHLDAKMGWWCAYRWI